VTFGHPDPRPLEPQQRTQAALGPGGPLP